MTNLSWYICVAAISVVIAIYTIYKKKDKYKISTLIVFYLFSATITWIGEFIVLGFFNSYAYKTGIFIDPWAQNLLGHLLLNTSMYPAAATVMAAYSLSNAWISLVTAIFVLTEYLFVKLGMYEQHWWRYYMSVIIVVSFSLITKKWFLKMNQKRYGAVRALTFYFVAMIIIHTPSAILLLLGNQHYHMDLVADIFSDFYLSSIIIAFIYHLFESFLLVLFNCVLKKWYWRLLPFIICPVIKTAFYKMNIYVVDDRWNLIYTILIEEICIAVFMLVEKYTLKPGSNKP